MADVRWMLEVVRADKMPDAAMSARMALGSLKTIRDLATKHPNGDMALGPIDDLIGKFQAVADGKAKKVAQTLRSELADQIQGIIG